MSDFYCEQVFSGKTKVDKLMETDRVLAFYHTRPSWTIHIVIVPKGHILSLLEADKELIDEVISIAKQVIIRLELNESNYKLITNGGSFQDSKHLHFHLVSGKKNK